jgi:adenylate kinase family enzyme
VQSSTAFRAQFRKRTRLSNLVLEAEEQCLPPVVISIDVPDEEIVERLASRRVCLTCGATFNLKLGSGGDHIAQMPRRQEAQ